MIKIYTRRSGSSEKFRGATLIDAKEVVVYLLIQQILTRFRQRSIELSREGDRFDD